MVMPRVGLVASDDLNRHTLQSVLSEAGYQVVVSFNPLKLTEYLQKKSQQRQPEYTAQNETDVWLVDLNKTDVQYTLSTLVEHSDQPLLVSDDIPAVQDSEAYAYWRRRLLEKLEVVAVTNRAGKDEQKPVAGTERQAKHVWVLAASLGGPEAVKQFLQALSPDLPIAMVYAQHIEARFDEVLADTVSNQQSYPVKLGRGEQHLQSGEIIVVPADRQLRFLPFGRAVETYKPWSGSYQPAIDQVVAELARLYKDRLGVIIFSGTCNDGAIGCRVVKACGGKVWVQTPDSCISPAMPEAAKQTGCVSYQGTPEQLAQAVSGYDYD